MKTKRVKKPRPINLGDWGYWHAEDGKPDSQELKKVIRFHKWVGCYIAWARQKEKP